MLNETIEGGAFLSADGTTWHNAAGEPLKKADAERAQKHADDQSQAVMDAEVRRMHADAQRDPVARALSALMQQQQGK